MIYGHTEWQPDPITPSQLAARLGLAPSTVTEMVKKLVAAGHETRLDYNAGKQQPLPVSRIGCRAGSLSFVTMSSQWISGQAWRYPACSHGMRRLSS